MREILFRGKRVDNDEWVEGAFCPDALEQIRGVSFDGFLDGFIRRFDTDSRKMVMYEVDRETVGQYTGLRDKNGKRIFEGDILRVWYEEYPDEFHITKVWAQGATLCVDVMGEDYDYTAINFADDVWSDTDQIVEIIGNIHDNPELIGGAEDG